MAFHCRVAYLHDCDQHQEKHLYATGVIVNECFLLVLHALYLYNVSWMLAGQTTFKEQICTMIMKGLMTADRD